MKFPLTAAVLAPALLTLPLFGAEAPTNLRAAAPFTASSNVELSWDDNSDDEDGFEFQLQPNGTGDWITLGIARRNQTLVSNITGAPPNVTDNWRVRARSAASGDSDWTDPVPLTIPDFVAIRSGTFLGPVEGEMLSINPPPTAGNPPVSWSATDLPPGMSIDTTTGVISGPAPAPGVHRPIIGVFDGSTMASTFLTLRVIAAPSGPVETAGPAAHVTLDASSALAIDLAALFSDPDAPEAVRIATNLGVIDTILYPRATPATVENFLNYVDDGDYTDVIFHRSVDISTAGVDVIQAGLMKPAGSKYAAVPLDPAVINEPGQSNLRGTIAVAKQGGNASSGTSQWYFNVNPNTNLDPRTQNGGFTVFGRAATLSLPVMDDIWSRPTGTYEAVIEGNPDSTVTFSGWPTTVVPAGPTPALDELIQISSVTRISPLDYDVTANSNPALGTADLTGSTLLFTPTGSATGAAELSLQVTDLDGNTLASSLTVCVLDLDMVPGISAGGSLEITFDHEKNIPGLVYEVQRSTDLVTWTRVWSTTDGFGAPEVTAQTDLGSRWRLTVEDPGSSPPDPAAAYLRIVVTKSP
ncbi:MAG: hypothetical protein HKN82_01530 [Akkermansiaceae bacterium]|nr:hypothetical protein [Akkermansiaceae bacterium]